jgi:Ca2+-binding EF-hand superfamily protein
LQAAGSHRLLERFDAIDTNKDGKITPEEMRAAWERRQ